MYLSDIGRFVFNERFRTAEIRSNVMLDEFVVMPNHIHGILVITDDGNKIVETTRRVVSTEKTLATIIG